MNYLNNINLDLLFRIDFNALIENSYTEEDSIKSNIQKFIDKYNFKNYYNRLHKYVRLTDLNDDYPSYLNYCKDLIKKDIFDCCQLEQAIGLFEKRELKAYLSTDSGFCYNT